MTRLGSLLVLCALVLPAGIARAMDAPAPESSREEHWRELSPQAQERLRERYRRYQALPAEQKERIQERLERWKRLTPQQRERIRERYEVFRKLTPDQRLRLHRNFRRWRQLSPAQQQQLRKRYEQFRKLTPEQRRHLSGRERPPSRR